MNKRNYYCLVAGLPDLIPDDKKLHFSSVKLRSYLQEELHPADFEVVKMFYLPWDHENLINLLYEKEFDWDERGNYSREDLEQFGDKKQIELIDATVFPSYFMDFVELFYNDHEALPKSAAVKFFAEKWYEALAGSGNQFVAGLGKFKQNMANIMLALNGRKHNIPFEEAIIGDDEVTHALKKSRSRDFGLAGEISDIENIVQIFDMENLLDRELKLDNHTWHYIDENTFFNYFTIEKVLGFVQKVFIVERWFELDKEKGQQIFSQLLEEIQSNFEFPEEFAITYGKR
ncbi:Protein of unknown function [Mariniphaga anaerophila]|uniref:DUF2764 domain-containing protein n=1 Tax=Mariniphaga anaerophila TaxID=1484053 RepID=A0A1M5DQM0_9BACT|nr:DUF2764 family protein [Mariniphaga anaerophila]SHF69287.1 Protein of unknown function [Mariniphaga anaerophila]